jgi:diaminopimelate decarboxylase
MGTVFPLARFESLQTPFYYYDMELLEQTLDVISQESNRYGYHVHYAIKANANERILKAIRERGFGADCVSGNEVQRAYELGFEPEGIVFAGVGKSDWEINLALDLDISCFNVESIPELEVIDELAALKSKRAKVALRINPNVNANTHHYITTGLEENKFGINLWDLEKVVECVRRLANVDLVGIHFHIGSQITEMESFVDLCLRVNELQRWFEERHIELRIINVGGGLGVDYYNPEASPVADFVSYFELFNRFLELREGQQLHFELGRSVVAPCGSLISRVLYIKEGVNTRFAIIDAGMNDLIRPALYQAYHSIQNLSSKDSHQKYDVVGPVCESSDCFGKAVSLPNTRRGDIIAIRTAGAYGEIMASRYNLRELAGSYFSDDMN